jgi:hypothetical protein
MIQNRECIYTGRQIEENLLVVRRWRTHGNLRRQRRGARRQYIYTGR